MTSEFSNFFRQAADEYLQAYIDMATRLDAEWIVVHAGFHFTNHRYHESLNNVTPADTYFGRDAVIIHPKEGKDQETDHPKTPLEPSTQSGLTSNQDEPDPLLQNRLRRPKCLDDGHYT